MQQLFPEGYFFSHVLYGMAWVNVGLLTGEADVKSRAIAEGDWTLKVLDGAEARAPFLRDTQVPNGVFYLGWVNRLRGGWLLLHAPPARPPTELARFSRDSAALARAFETHRLPNLEAYPGQTWHCDNVMALASLAVHDAVAGSNYKQTLVKRWLGANASDLDAKTGVLPHQIDAHTGAALIGPRASTQVYMHALLPELDAAFASEQYARYRGVFVVPVLGFLPVLEYPRGTQGEGDVDTGPLVFGIGPSATVVSIAAARANNDQDLYARTVALSEAFGFPATRGEERAYAFGQIIIADAFLAWGKSLTPWSPVNATPPAREPPTGWRLVPHAVSVLLALPAVVLFVHNSRLLRRSRLK
jgi:hypothetical protein